MEKNNTDHFCIFFSPTLVRDTNFLSADLA